MDLVSLFLRHQLERALAILGRLAILAILASFMIGCSTTTIVKRWHVHPDNVAQFKVDEQRCVSFARGNRNAENLFDYCLQTAGYRLEIQQE